MNIYGKSVAPIIEQKKSFINDNEKHLKKQQEISKYYTKQPIRKKCKNCDNKLSGEVDFIKDKIGYKICDECEHLNGAFEDTNEFCELVYTESDGKKYAENYNTEDVNAYNYRVTSIYSPKAEFLYTSLLNAGEQPSELKYVDFGAGSGYFVSALDKIGLINICGTEVSDSQIKLANYMLGKELIKKHELHSSKNVLLESEANVISMIGVLEHLQNPREILETIKMNKNIKYLFLSVPLFSLSVYLEMLTDKVFHRQLHGGHTHLYTEKSLTHLIQEFDFDIVSQWWFGTDLMDLYRTIFVNLENKNVSEKIKKHYKKMMKPFLDSCQQEIDKCHSSSEVHILLKKKS